MTGLATPSKASDPEKASDTGHGASDGLAATDVLDVEVQEKLQTITPDRSKQENTVEFVQPVHQVFLKGHLIDCRCQQFVNSPVP